MNTTITVEAPAFSKGEGMQRLRLTFPSFAELVYDPVRCAMDAWGCSPCLYRYAPAACTEVESCSLLRPAILRNRWHRADPPARSTLPCSSFATSDAVLNSELQSALEGSTTSAAAARSPACLGAAMVAAAAATGLLLL